MTNTQENARKLLEWFEAMKLILHAAAEGNPIEWRGSDGQWKGGDGWDGDGWHFLHCDPARFRVVTPRNPDREPVDSDCWREDKPWVIVGDDERDKQLRQLISVYPGVYPFKCIGGIFSASFIHARFATYAECQAAGVEFVQVEDRT